MPKKKFTIPRTPWLVRIPEDVATTVDLLLLDPMSGKPKYGEKSKLVTQLLRQWVQEQRREFMEKEGEEPIANQFS